MENNNIQNVFLIPSIFDPFTWTQYNFPKNSKFKKVYKTSECDAQLAIDSYNFDFLNNSKKILLLVEPIGIIEQIYNLLNDYNFVSKIDLIATHHKRFVDNKKIIQIKPPIPTQITEQKIYNKTKLCSLITSLKNYAPGHKLRIEILNKKLNNLDAFGYGFNPVKKKEEGLKDYCFSFAIENCRESGYYTEKILDCFLTGTIPIYWGDPEIETTFDKNGIIFLNKDFNYNNLSFELYNSKLSYVAKNFDIAKKIKYNIDSCIEEVLNEI